jgi:hypothetical protein
MTRVINVVVALGICATVNTTAASAQATTGSSGIAGVVKDPSGAVLPGVTVEAASPALIEKVRTVVTDEQGQYKIIDLRPGTYTVTYGLSGFSTLKREDLELPANFTATVNVELKVGAIEETVTVTSESPLVDVQNVTHQTTLSQTLLQTMPTSKSVLGFAALTPAVITPPESQDVGGSKAELSARLAIHGGKAGDQKLLQDGLRYNSMSSNGANRGFYIDPAAAQEILVELGAGGSAEYSVGGVQINLIPKDGGNRFAEYFYSAYTNHDFQSSNLSPALQAQGLLSVNSNRSIYDLDGSFGGPAVRDKLWFFYSQRFWGDTTRVANLFHNANPIDSWTFTPNLNDPGEPVDRDEHSGLRLTSQLTRRNKVTLSFDFERNHQGNNYGTFLTGTTAWESGNIFNYKPDYVSQASWTFPATNKLLLSAGVSVLQFSTVQTPAEPGAQGLISVLEQTTNFQYRAPLTYGPGPGGQSNQRFSVSYVSGGHNLKAGLFMMEGATQEESQRAPSATSYTFSSGVPISITEYAYPLNTRELLRPELGLFAQDQWTKNRLTLNLGLRFEYIHSYVPAQTQPAGLFVPARSYAKVDCVPCWKDIDPRFGVAYDLFGDGKTAVKASLGRYVNAQTTSWAQTFNPVNASVNSVTRPWTDSNGNFVPDCDLTNPQANGECGPISNFNFGQPNIVTHADPALMNAWQKRDYNWQASASVDHQVGRGISVGAGLYRTWYGNQTVTNNLDAPPSDYQPYCVTAPVSPNLPGGGGNQICGLYDIMPSAFGHTNNVVTFASNFGKYTDVYNGADANFAARLPRGAMVSGGFNIGNSVSQIGSALFTTNHTNNCFVVNSPQQLYQCNIAPPYFKRFRVSGSYPLPANFQVAANFQSLPGPEIIASDSFTTAQVAQSLGRPLAGGVKTVTINLIQPWSDFGPRINQFDIRLTKKFRVAGGTLQGMFDIYNLLNANAVVAFNGTYGPNWLRPEQVLDGRLLKFGFQMEF